MSRDFYIKIVSPCNCIEHVYNPLVHSATVSNNHVWLLHEFSILTTKVYVREHFVMNLNLCMHDQSNVIMRMHLK